MAFTVSFPTSGPLPGLDDLASWLVEQGEAFEPEGADVLALRALPVRLVHEGDAIRAQLDVTRSLPLTRLVLLLFDLSARLRADVRLVGTGEVTRAQLWLRLADEQDRQRIVHALAAASSTPHQEEVLRAFWGLLSALGDRRDLRWDAARQRIVEMREVGGSGGIGLDEATWHADEPSVGDVVAVPVDGDLHILAWRWLAEAYPSLAQEVR